MKKSLIALAALASVAGGASAQSTVTLYGAADAWVGRTEDKLTDTKVNRLTSGGFNGSRWGLKGSEDLGGGLKAVFQLEQGFNIDDASNANGATTFSRQAFVGLAGAFGEVRLGRQYTAYDELRGSTNAAYDTSFTRTGDVWASADGDYAGRANNQAYYMTPSLGGFGAAVGAAAGEGVGPRILSGKVQYAAGPIVVGLAHQQEGVKEDKVKYTLLAGSYDLGVVKLTGGFNRQNSKAPDTKSNEFQVGVSVPFGAAAIAVGYASAKSKVEGETTVKARGFNVLGLYDLSKRTRLYASYAADNAKDGGGEKFVDRNKFGAGVRHWF